MVVGDNENYKPDNTPVFLTVSYNKRLFLQITMILVSLDIWIPLIWRGVGCYFSEDDVQGKFNISKETSLKWYS